MANYLDKTGLSYLWSKLKGKLNNKADNDKYRIAKFTTPKTDYTINNNVAYMLDGEISITNPTFVESFPSDYHIVTILNIACYKFDKDGKKYPVKVRYYDSTTALNYASVPVYHISPISDGKQKWEVSLTEWPQGGVYAYQAEMMVLLEKD